MAIGLAMALTVPAKAQPKGDAVAEGSSALAALQAHQEWRTPEDLFRQVIETAYDTLSEYACASGSDLTFKLNDFRTYFPDEFDSVFLTDLDTMPDGRVIDVGHSKRSVMEAGGSIKKIVRYEASWRDQEASWRLSAETSEAAVVTLGKAIRRLGQEQDARFKNTRAVTSVRVTATLGGESRSYRALTYWFSKENDPTWGHFDLLLVDNITQGVERALREEIPLEGEVISPPSRPSLDQKGVRGQGRGSLLLPKVSCVPSVTSGSYPIAGMGTNSHLYGSHNASAALGYTCGCDSTCRVTCSAYVHYPSCGDSGVTTVCHKMATDNDGEVVALLNALPRSLRGRNT